MGLIVGIDASRSRSGGAVAHLIGILSECDPNKHGIDEIHIWSQRGLLDQIPDSPWLVKHNPKILEKGLLKQIAWQAVSLSTELRAVNCNILFSTSGTTFSSFKPMITLSQDMLSYEPGVMNYFGFGYFRLRLQSILFIQNLAFRRSQGVIFLTKYAARVVQQSCGRLANMSIVPHGVDDAFRGFTTQSEWPLDGQRRITCIYVSNLDMYKHQWEVVRAISELNSIGRSIDLKLVGASTLVAEKLVDEAIDSSYDNGRFVERIDFVAHDEIPLLLANSDIFIFASSCENMPVTLIEGMSMGLPIACSDRGPMPEVLGNGGVYFDPEDASSISNAIAEILDSSKLRLSISSEAKRRSENYNWKRCSDETFDFIATTYKSLSS